MFCTTVTFFQTLDAENVFWILKARSEDHVICWMQLQTEKCFAPQARRHVVHNRCGQEKSYEAARPLPRAVCTHCAHPTAFFSHMKSPFGTSSQIPLGYILHKIKINQMSSFFRMIPRAVAPEALHWTISHCSRNGSTHGEFQIYWTWATPKSDVPRALSHAELILIVAVLR